MKKGTDDRQTGRLAEKRIEKYGAVKKDRATKISMLVLLALLIGTGVFMLFASGIFASAPKVDTAADNCYEETLRVITDDDYVPYSYYDAEGRMSGHDVELIILLANEMRMNLDLRFEPWSDGIRDTVDGKADVLMTCDYSDSFEGTDKLLMSVPLTYDEFTVFSKDKISSTDELFGKRIAIMDNGNVMPHIGMLSLKGNCLLLKDNREALRALEDGTADCAIMRNTVGEALLKELGFTDIESYISIGPSYLCFGISNDNAVLLGRINDAIETLRHNGQLDKLRNEWLTSFVHTQTFTELIENNLWIGGFFALLIIAILLLVIANSRSNAVAEEKTRRAQMAKMAGGVSAYIVDPVTERFRIISQDEYLAENYKDDEDFNASFSRYIENDVFEPDRKTVAEKISVPAMVRALETGNEYIVRYRDISSGVPRWYEMRAVRLSDREILYGFSDKDAGIINQTVYKTLEDGFFALYYVDLENGLAKTLKRSPWYDTGEAGVPAAYSPMMLSFASAFEGETREFFEKISSTDYLKARFAKEDKAVYTYKSPLISGSRWASVTEYVLTRREDGTPSALALGFSVLDEDASRKEETGIKLKETTEVIGGLANEYTALYHVDLDTDEYVSYHLTGRTEDIRPYQAEHQRFTDLAHGFADSGLVDPEFRDALRGFYPSASEVKERMKDRKRISMLFKRNYGGKFLWTEVSVVKCEEEREEAHNIIVGFVEKDEETRKRTEQFIAVDEANRLVDNIASKYSVAFTVNMRNGAFTILKIDEKISRKFDEFSSFAEARTSLSSILHANDRERMMTELSFDSIRAKLKNARSYTVEYRTCINGVTNWHEMNVTSVDDDEVALGFAEKDLEITKRHLEDRRYGEYIALFIIDLDTEMIKPLKTSPLFETAGIGEAAPYREGMSKFAATYAGEAKEFFTRISDPEYLRGELAKDDKRTFSYKSAKLDSDKWIDVISYVILRHDDGTPAMVSLGFTLVDALASVRKELLSRLTEDMQMIGGLASEYYALYYLNIDENFFKVYSLDGKKLPKAAALVDKGGSPVDVFSQFARSDLIHPDDRSLFACLSVDELRRRLAHSKKFSVRFRRNYDGTYRWTEMDVVKYEKIGERANAIAVGFAERDALIRSEQAINNSFDVLGQELPPDEAVDRILSITADFYGAERCYVFEYAKNIGILNNTYEWCKAGIEPMIDKLQGVPLDAVEGWNREFERQGAFYMDALDSEHNTEETRAILEMQGIESLVAAPLLSGDEIVGFVGVDNPAMAKKDISILSKAASVIFSEILQRKENDEEHVTLGKLTDAFLSVYYADLSSDYMRTWKIAEEYKDAYGTVQHYSEAMGGYVRRNIAERDRARCVEMASAAYILEQFRTTDRFSVDMTDIMLGYERSVVADFIKVNAEGTQFVLCFRDVTETLEREKQQQQTLREALDREITRAREEKTYQLAILNNAYSYFRINLAENRIIPPIIERENGQPVDYTDRFPAPLPSYNEVMALGADRYVDEAYKESYRAYHNVAYLTECFENGDLMPEYTCRIYSSTLGWHYRKYITYLSRDEISGEIYGMSVAYDVTREHEANQKEQQYKAELEIARNAAEAANRSKTTFLFNMSHDIRTPMNAITGFTAMAKKHIGEQEKVSDYLDKIDMSGQQLLTLVNQVLEMARIESGRITLEENPVNIRDEYEIAVTVLSEQAKVNGLTFTHSLSNIRHYRVLADEARMNSITLNITGNAMKYTPRGGSVDFSLREVPARREGYASFVFTVEDTGIGMSEEYQKVLFEPFTREKSSTVSRIQGTGLGMSIVKELVDLLGGTIEVKSELGKGTRFDITVDFRIDETAGKAADAAAEGETVSLAGRRALLVEDNELNREIALEMLHEEGLIVEDADDGTTAVETLKEKGPDHYDFILMDIQMPVMDGYTATKKIREMYPERHIPIIALSANAFAEDKAASIAAGMDDHVAKPINVKELVSALAKCL